MKHLKEFSLNEDYITHTSKKFSYEDIIRISKLQDKEVIQENKNLLKEDVYWEKEPPYVDKEKELQDFITKWVDDQMGLDAGFGTVILKDKRITIGSRSYKNKEGNFAKSEIDPIHWEETGNDLIDDLRIEGWDGWRIGNFGKSSVWLTKD